MKSVKNKLLYGTRSSWLTAKWRKLKREFKDEPNISAVIAYSIFQIVRLQATGKNSPSFTLDLKLREIRNSFQKRS
jgi:predicted HAD superfamily hydrolase